jgi:hypothetical protein
MDLYVIISHLVPCGVEHADVEEMTRKKRAPSSTAPPVAFR